MSELILDVRLDGHADPIGNLVRDQRGAIAFAYSPAYAGRSDAVPLSLSLPLRDEPYADVQARAFFENLLQERDGDLATIMAREGLARDDIAGILFHLGKDCAGALSVLPFGSPPAKVPGDFHRDYDPLSDDRLAEIVQSLHRRRRLPADMRDPSPLAGMQSKIALTRLPSGNLAEPRRGSGAPTTHILKVPDQDSRHDASLETAAMTLSRELGFETADVDLVSIAGIEAILVTRFDRARDADGRIVRVHQEDFAQALGLPPALKYERRGTPGRRFDAKGIRRVLGATADPAAAVETFAGMALFDLMIGNADGHAKNFALLYESGPQPRLAPRYDVLPTRLDGNLTDELAFRIGEASHLDDISAENFDAFLADLGVVRPNARSRKRKELSKELATALIPHLGALERSGLKLFADLIAANLKILLGSLGVKMPAAVASRDAFVNRGGGWLLS